MSDLLLLTVGTGTAGRHSDLASGLRHTISKLAPRRFWLAPSADENSRAMADLVRENLSAFSPASDTDRFFTLAAHDDLDSCRRTLRAAIAQLRHQLQPGERLILNPTSGTKQMTAAAVLAALDENLGEIIFTTGDRADGVVITGTERLTAFNPAGYFRERDFATAQDLFAAGAFAAAARVLQPHAAALPQSLSLCHTLHHWRRFAYTDAVTAAGGHHEELRRNLATRQQHAAAATPSLVLLADVLAWAEHARRLGDAGDCLTLAYKALELAARFALFDACGLRPTRTGRFQLDAVRAVARSTETDSRLAKLAREGEVALGLGLACNLLAENSHPLGRAFEDNPQLRQLTYVRNETVHDLRPPTMADAQSLLDRVRNLITETLGTVTTSSIPSALPPS